MSAQAEPQLVQALRTAMVAATEQGVSLREQSRRSGVDFGSVSRFVSGKRDVTATTAGKLAAAIGLELVVKKAVNSGKKK